MDLFFDTEFTGLQKDTTLISIGIVSEYGDEFYAEFTDYDTTQVNDWIRDNVISNLYLPSEGVSNRDVVIDVFKYNIKDTKDKVKELLIDWLGNIRNRSVVKEFRMISDVAHYDFVLFIDIFGDAFSLCEYNISSVCHDINTDIAKAYRVSESKAFDITRENILKNNNVQVEGKKHNSLYDAKVIKEIFNIVY